jgi:hypothetical protein
MKLNDQKEQVSFAYVRAVAAFAGLDVIENPYNPDDDSVDIQIRSMTARRAKLEAQLKCTACEPFPANADRFSFDLPTKNYNDLVRDCLTPRVLIVVTLPVQQAEWYVHSEQELLVRRCGYYVSLLGNPESRHARSVRVWLPRENVLTPTRLTELMAKIDSGEAL